LSGKSDDNWFSAETATFGDRLAAAREAAGMSQSDLARRIGVRAKTVSQWEADASEPRANRLQMLGGMLNVSLMWLLTGEGDGIEAPDRSYPQSAEINALLVDLRQLQSDMTAFPARLARIENRLRQSLAVMSAQAGADMQPDAAE
jgi:transcriptional regulator with XRE-family HTH domain